MAALPIELPRVKVEEFCVRHQVRKLSLFGSVLTPKFGPSSDIDVLVEFEPGQGPGYLGLSAMELELSDLAGRKVDLRTPGEISRYFRDEVLTSAAVQYDRG